MTAEQGTGPLDLKFKQGDDVSYRIRFPGLDAQDFRAQIREKKSPDSALVAEFSVSTSLEGTDTVVVLSLSADDNTRAGTFRWDLESTTPTIRTWLEGECRITGEVSING
jgi:hypothetical protein